MQPCRGRVGARCFAVFASVKYVGMPDPGLVSAVTVLPSLEVTAWTSECNGLLRFRDLWQSFAVRTKRFAPFSNKTASSVLARLTGGDRKRYECSDEFVRMPPVAPVGRQHDQPRQRGGNTENDYSANNNRQEVQSPLGTVSPLKIRLLYAK